MQGNSAETAQPCGLHKAYNYLAAESLSRILEKVEQAYGELELAQPQAGRRSSRGRAGNLIDQREALQPTSTP